MKTPSRMLVVTESQWLRMKLSVAILGIILTIVLVCSYLGYNKLSGSLRATQEALRHFGILMEQTEKENASLRETKKQQERKEKAVVSYIMTQNPHIREDEARKLAHLEIKYSSMYSVPLALGLAITARESTFNATAKSPTGPVGIKQVACSWHCNTYGVTKRQLYDEETNIRVGYAILADYKKQAKTWNGALEMYYGSEKEWENARYSRAVLTTASNVTRILSQV